MKNYDNYFLPIDNIEDAKHYYHDILGLEEKFDFSDKEWSLIKSAGRNRPLF